MDEMIYTMPSNEERLKHLDAPYKYTWSKEEQDEECYEEHQVYIEGWNYEE